MAVSYYIGSVLSMFIRPELLAPAGSFDALRAAIWAGADAVYLGGKSFSARAGAVNFDEQALQQAVLFAHRAGVKVYVTVNTLLKQEELPAAISFLHYLHSIGADAAIVQDLGLAKLARHYVPKLELHASTQMTTTSLHGVRALKELGLSRVVLARELSLAQISEISSASVLPIEVFLHGALCVGYSGQCLFSSMLGGRSGNRGQCAQPCRLPYASSKAESHYVLSPRDLCLIDRVPELLSAGVSSLKIEGRLKRPEYVAEVVSIYRRAIDEVLATGSFVATAEDHTRLAQAFNRGFTEGYLYNKPRGNFYSGHRPDNQGVAIGRVLSLWGRNVSIRLDTRVNVGDVIDIEGVTAVMEQPAMAGDTITLELREPVAVSLGAPIARVVDAERNTALMQAVSTYEPPRTPINWSVHGAPGSRLLVRAECSGVVVDIESDGLLEEARTHSDPHGMLERQLQKLGGTPFAMGTLVAHVSSATHIPLSEINNCRRKAVDELMGKLWGGEHRGPAPELAFPTVSRPQKSHLVVSVLSMGEADAAVSGGADYLLVGQEWLAVTPARLIELYREVSVKYSGVHTALRLPRILHTREELSWQELMTQGVEVYASSPGAVKVALDRGCVVRGDSGLNIMNSASCEALAGVQSVTLSLELASKEMAQLAKHTERELEVIVHGRTLLMATENCIWSGDCKARAQCKGRKKIRDRKGIDFPVVTDINCRSYILNSHVLSLIDHLGQLERMGISRLRLELAGSGPELVGSTVKNYREALLAGPNRERVFELRATTRSQWGLLTRGHWQRGV